MMRNKSLIQVGVLLLISILSACNTSEGQFQKQVQKKGEGFQVKKYHYQVADSLKEYLEVDINYFQLVGDYDFANVINNVILDKYQGAFEGGFDNPNNMLVAYFNQRAAEIDTLINEMGISNFVPYTFNYTAEPIVINDSLFTFTQSFYEFTGGAHGNYTEKYSNYNVKTIEKLSLKDLFSEEDLEILTQMGEEAFRKTQRIPENKSLKEFGYELPEGFLLNDNFLLGKKSIKFYYAPYEIACYAMGESSFELSYKSIRKKMPNAGLFKYVN